MGLRLIYGRAGTGKSEKCYKEISEKISNQPNLRRTVIRIPEEKEAKIQRLYDVANRRKR